MIDLSIRPSRRRAVASHVAMGGVLQIVLVAQSLVIVPLGVHKIGENPFGLWLATGGILSWLTVANFGSAGLTMQRCAAAYGRDDLQALRDWYVHGMLVAAASALFLACLLLPAAAVAPGWLGATDSVARSLTMGMMIAGIGAALTPLNDTARGVVCALQRNGIGVGAEVIASIVGLVFTIYTVWVGWGISGLAWGGAIRIMLALGINGAVATFYMSHAQCRTRWSRPIMREFAITLVPLWSSSVILQLLPQLPLVLLAKMLGPEAGPAASVAYTATMRPIILVEMLTMHGVMSTSTALSHLVSDARTASTAGTKIRTLMSVVYAALGGGVVLYCFGAHGFVSLWVGEQAFLGQSFVFAAAIASFASIQVRSLVNLGASLGMVGETASFQAIEGLARAVALVCGVALLGPLGIPIVTAIFTVGAGAIVEAKLAGRSGFPARGTGRMPWLIWTLVGCVLASTAATSMTSHSWWTWFCAMAVATAVVSGVVFATSPEMRRLLGALRRRRSQKVLAS